MNGSENGERFQVGVFDSGFGGLTVLRSLVRMLPRSNFLYLGDTARLPYGSKSRATIARYALSSARFLIEQGAGFLVVACNTASALAFDEIDALCREKGISALGVIESGVDEARRLSRTRDILVLGTEATMSSHAYAKAGHDRGLRALEKACPLLAPLVEEGWVDHPVTTDVVRIYLSEASEQARREGLNPDTLVLGCTHYPLLRAAIEGAAPPGVRVIDSAESVAAEAARRIRNGTRIEKLEGVEGQRRFFATDSVEKFQRLGAGFLGSPIGRVELVDLGG